MEISANTGASGLKNTGASGLKNTEAIVHENLSKGRFLFLKSRYSL